MASTPYKDGKTGEWKDGNTVFMTCVVWRQQAENVAESLQCGTRMIVSGRLQQHTYDIKDGEKRTVYEVLADEIGPSLRNATATIAKVTRPARRPTRPPAGGPASTRTTSSRPDLAQHNARPGRADRAGPGRRPRRTGSGPPGHRSAGAPGRIETPPGRAGVSRKAS